MKYEFTEQELRFLKMALIHLQGEISEDLREFTEDKEKTNYYYFLCDRLDACNMIIDKLHNWGI